MEGCLLGLDPIIHKQDTAFAYGGDQGERNYAATTLQPCKRRGGVLSRTTLSQVQQPSFSSPSDDASLRHPPSHHYRQHCPHYQPTAGLRFDGDERLRLRRRPR